jgi:predicted Zn-dependent protease with MMP-like domain
VTDEPLHLEPEQFDLLVSEVMDELPQEWAPLLDKMAVVVEDEPAEDDLPAGQPPETPLLGRYRGTAPLQLIGGGLTGPAVAAPPEIALFQGPLERASSSLDDLRRLVHDTLVQQIGRYLGYKEDPPDEDGELADEDEDES